MAGCGSRRCWFSCFSICGLLLLVLSGLLWVIVSPVIYDMVLVERYVYNEDSVNYPYWESNWRDEYVDPPANPEYEKFSVFNLTNMEAVRDTGERPHYVEIGPFTYRVNKTKFDIEFTEEGNQVSYRRFRSYHFEPSMSVMDDTTPITNINPAYFGTIEVGGSELIILQALVGPVVAKMIQDIRTTYIADLLNNDPEHWQTVCLQLDPDCETDEDMAYVQWGYYNLSDPTYQYGLNNEAIQVYNPELFPDRAEWSVFGYEEEWGKTEALNIPIASARKLLDGPMGLNTDANNMEPFTIACFGDDEEAMYENWGLTIEQCRKFVVQYTTTLSTTYSKRYMENEVIGKGSGLFITRSAKDMLFDAFDPILYIFSKDDPSARIFLNHTDIEHARATEKFWEIYTGMNDPDQVEQMIRWESQYNFSVWFPGQDPVPVEGHSGGGQFPLTKVDGTGKPPKYMDPVYVWSSDHGRAIWFDDHGEHAMYHGIDSHVVELRESTYEVSEQYQIPEGYRGFINATGINEGVPIYYCQPRFEWVDEFWVNQIDGITPGPHNETRTVFMVEPITGVAVGSDIRLQVNFYLQDKERYSIFYPNVSEEIMYPHCYVHQYGAIDEANSAFFRDSLFIYLDMVSILFIAGLAVGALLLVIGLIGIFASKPRATKDYERIN